MCGNNVFSSLVLGEKILVEEIDGAAPALQVATPLEKPVDATQPVVVHKSTNDALDLAFLAAELGYGSKNPRKKDIPLAPDYSVIRDCAAEYIAPVDRAAFEFIYLTGQRVSEALEVKRADVSVREDNGREYMVVDSITLKNRDNPRRVLPVPMDPAEKVGGWSSDMARRAWARIEPLSSREYVVGGFGTAPLSVDPKDVEAYLHQVDRTTITHHLGRVKILCRGIRPKTRERVDLNIPIFPHLLRHCRATHFSDAGMDGMKMMQYFGWASLAMPNLYASINWRALARGLGGI